MLNIEKGDKMSATLQMIMMINKVDNYRVDGETLKILEEVRVSDLARIKESVKRFCPKIKNIIVEGAKVKKWSH